MSYQLSLTEYSAKYKVSISTLRRRIKKGEVDYTQEGGKYLLPDRSFDELLEMDTAPPTRRKVNSRSSNVAPPQESDDDSVAIPFLKPLGLDISFDNDQGYSNFDEDEYEEQEVDDHSYNETALTVEQETTSKALVELKKAYTLVLSEKEEQILNLKQHIVDLQTLNKALESEVGRLQSEASVDLKTSFFKHDF